MESINDALIACVKALGGSKVVGPMLWPEKPSDAAQRCLLDCLNQDRQARLSPEQIALLLRKARQAGYHEAAEWLMADIGYAPPVPIAPKDELAELQRRFIEAVAIVRCLGDKIERVSPGALRSVG